MTTLRIFTSAGCELTFDYDMEFYGSEDVKCLCGAPKCRGTLGKKCDEGDKGKVKSSKSGTSSARKSVSSTKTKKADALEMSGSVERKKRVDLKAKLDTEAAKAAKKNAGSKRKEPESGQGEDDFFSSLPPREKKRQMELMKKLTSNRSRG